MKKFNPYSAMLRIAQDSSEDEIKRLEDKAKYFEKTDPEKARQLRARAAELKRKG